MSYVNAHKEILSRFKDGWGATTPISWPNVSFTPDNKQKNWVRISIKDVESVQMDMGSPSKTFRSNGLIFIQAFSQPNTGPYDLLDLADKAANVFRNWCGVSVRCRAASVKDASSGADGWYQILVTIPFQRDEII